MTTVLGIDEAGRGPVIGPMVICGYMMDKCEIGRLKELGVRDSKMLSPRTRERIARQIKNMAKDFIIINLSAEDIDKLRTETNLNKIEIEKMSQIINLLSPDEVVIDSPEVNTKKFENKIRAKLKNKKTKLVCENYADKKYPIVGAASILAKVTRDNAIKKIKSRYKAGFGTGYPSDERTIEFLKQWIREHKEFPSFVRKSWVTAKLIIKNHREEKEQKKLDDFAK